MDIATLTRFLMWCTILNGGLLVFWTVTFLLAPELVYATQSRWFPLERETWNAVFYGFIGAFKLLVIVFNLVPYVALLLVG